LTPTKEVQLVQPQRVDAPHQEDGGKIVRRNPKLSNDALVKIVSAALGASNVAGLNVAR
jgi:hypothetical protein